jgi:hypothetical protein
MIDFVQIELGGERWTISWDSDATLKKVRCIGSKTGLKYCTYLFQDFTPDKAFDLAMTQLKWLREEFKNVKQTGME